MFFLRNSVESRGGGSYGSNVSPSRSGIVVVVMIRFRHCNVQLARGGGGWGTACD